MRSAGKAKLYYYKESVYDTIHEFPILKGLMISVGHGSNDTFQLMHNAWFMPIDDIPGFIFKKYGLNDVTLECVMQFLHLKMKIWVYKEIGRKSIENIFIKDLGERLNVAFMIEIGFKATKPKLLNLLPSSWGMENELPERWWSTKEYPVPAQINVNAKWGDDPKGRWNPIPTTWQRIKRWVRLEIRPRFWFRYYRIKNYILNLFS